MDDSEPVLFLLGFFFFSFRLQVCEDIDECLGPPENGGCTANSHCYNTMVTSCQIEKGWYKTGVGNYFT